MASTGNVFPTSGTTVDRAGSAAWTSPGNITADDTTNATTTTTPTDYLIASAFGFAIPANAIILGVTVRIEMAETGAGSSNYIPQLISATTPTLIGAAKSAITVTTGPTISTSGSTTDLWGANLTPAIVNAAGFGVAIWSTDTTNALQCDFVTIAIEYVVPSPRSVLPTRFGPFLPPQRGIGSTQPPPPPSAALIEPPQGTLTLVGFAPAVPLSIAPPSGTLTLTGFAPAVPLSIAPPSGTLVLVGNAPTVLTPQSVAPPSGTLTLVGYEPIVTTAVIVAVPSGTLTLVGNVPTVLTPLLVAPPSGSLPLVGFAPTVLTPVTIPPPSGTLTLAAFAPAVPLAVQIPDGALPLVGYAPTVIGTSVPALIVSALPTRLGPFLPPRRGTGSTLASTGLAAVPNSTLTLTAYAPTVTIAPPPWTIVGRRPAFGPFLVLFRRGTGSAQTLVSGTALVQPPSATITLEGYAPVVLAGTTIAPPSGTLTLTGFAPSVLTPNTVAVPLGTLVLTGFAPTVLTPQLVTPPLGTLVLTGFAPTVSTGASVAVPLGTLTLTAFAPDVLTPSVGLVLVPAGELPLVGYAPTVLGDSLGAPEGGGGGGPEHFMPMSQSIGLRKKKREDDEPVPPAAEGSTTSLSQESVAPATAAPAFDLARLERAVRDLEETDALVVEIQAAKAQLAAKRAIMLEEQEALEVLRAILAEDDE